MFVHVCLSRSCLLGFIVVRVWVMGLCVSLEEGYYFYFVWVGE